MRSKTPARLWHATVIPLALGAAILAGCGGGGTEPSKVSLSIFENGKSARFRAPNSIPGGLVEVSLRNAGNAVHAAQFGLIVGNHSVADALKVLGGNSNKTPDWLRTEGGVSQVPAGKTGTATLNLPAGKYVLVDIPGNGPTGPPATGQLHVGAGDTGDLPSTAATVAANQVGKDKYRWNIAALKAGTNQITFDSKGKDALHEIEAIRLTKNVSLAALKNSFKAHTQPNFIDPSTLTDSAVLDGGKSEAAQLTLSKPGQYLFFCPLTDRDGGKPHLLEGLLTKINVK